jgi:hypothetical protein
MFNSIGAILFGITMGFTSLIPLTAVNNNIATRNCVDQSTTHTLVTVRAFAGTSKHCVDRRYITPVNTDRTATHYGPGY